MHRRIASRRRFARQHLMRERRNMILKRWRAKQRRSRLQWCCMYAEPTGCDCSASFMHDLDNAPP